MVIRANGTRLELETPYHPALPYRARQVGGTWLGLTTGWVFPLKAEQALRALCQDIWAVDGSAAAVEDVVDLQITVDERVPFRSVFEALETPIYLVGREIAASLRNLRGARPGRGIHFLSGKPRCLASPSTWSTSIPDGAVFQIRDVPRCAIGRLREAVGSAGHLEGSAS
jgi:hypothetical protein